MANLTPSDEELNDPRRALPNDQDLIDVRNQIELATVHTYNRANEARDPRVRVLMAEFNNHWVALNVYLGEASRAGTLTHGDVNRVNFTYIVLTNRLKDASERVRKARSPRFRDLFGRTAK